MKKRWVFVWAVVSSAIAQGQMNPIEGGTTEMVSGQWDVVAPWLMVGSNSGSNTLFVSSGGQVNNQVGIIGNNVGSVENMAFISGANAVWSNAFELTVGNQGSDNVLAIFDGGRVETVDAFVGKASSNNYLMANGAGSEFIAENVHVGHTGSENSFSISDGAIAATERASLGHWIGSDDNAAFVRGTNAVWNNSSTLNVGEYGANNMLLITDGGAVRSPVMNVGADITSSNNVVSLWGEGSVLDTDELNIGGTATTAGGLGNRVSVRDSGRIEISELTIHAGNKLDLNDGGTLAIDNGFNASTDGFNWNDGGHLSLTGNLSGMPSTNFNTGIPSYQYIEGSGKTLTLDGGTWNAVDSSRPWHDTQRDWVVVGWGGDSNTLNITNSGLVESGRLMIGDSDGSSYNRVLVSGSNSLCDVDGLILIGNGGGVGNALEIVDGGRVDAYSTDVGSWGDGSENLLRVSGTGSVLSSTSEIIVGQYGTDNTMIIENGGVATTHYGIIGDDNWGADRNVAIIDGVGSRWEAWNELTVGDGGANNRMVITNGATVISDNNAFIGKQTDADDNVAIVTGGGSSWSGISWLRIGSGSSGNRLEVNDGGGVEADVAHIGSLGFYGYPAGGNSVVVEGEGSEFKVNQQLYVGLNQNKDNILTVANGGRVLVGEMDIANLPGIGSSAAIVVGDTNGTAQLIASNGSLINSERGYIGLGEGETGTVVIETGSKWTNSDWMYVGKGGSGNTLLIQNGGKVDSGLTLIGYDASASNNSVVVTGSGSELDLSSLHLGREGSAHRLEVLNGALADVGGLYMSSEGRSSNNVAIVDGIGSTMDIDQMYVGYEGDGNRVEITNGGKVVSDYTQLGKSFISADNSVLVSGDGSVLSNNNSMYVGYWGDNNSLLIEDGGKVYTRSLFAMSDSAASTGNTVVVTGNGSTLESASSSFIVGIEGRENTMQVLDGAQVLNTGNALVGYQYQSDNNTVLVSGTNSAWRNTGKLSVGYSGEDNTMLVVDGGLLTSKGAEIGRTDTAHNNLVLVSGEGSVWQNDGSLVMGATGSGANWNAGGTGNVLVVEDGGMVLVGNADTNNLPIIGNAGSLVVADSELVIANGSRVITDYTYIGLGAEDSGILHVASGSQMAVSNTLVVGYAGSGNEMVVSGDSTLYTEEAFIGFGNTATDNEVNISAGTWSNKDDLYVGYEGSGNTLAVSDGAAVLTGNTFVEGQDNGLSITGDGSRLQSMETFSLDGYGNSVDVEDGAWLFIGNVNENNLPTNEWTGVQGGVVVGGSGAGVELVVDNGSTLNSLGRAYIGLGSNEVGRVAVTGTGSQWNIGGYFYMGVTGSSNVLEIAGGGSVISRSGRISSEETSHNNAVIVEGATSEWLVDSEIFVGYRGAGNSLDIGDGARATSSSGVIGFHESASGNMATVSGDGSVWHNGAQLAVGLYGSDNTLTITDGGNITSKYGFLGKYVGSSNNYVRLAGSGSEWEVDEFIDIGSYGAGNKLEILDGGRITSGSGSVGSYSDHNHMLVSGEGSEWNSAGGISVGTYGYSNRLEITNGGSVTSSGVSLVGGNWSAAGSNHIMVSGEGSVFNSQDVYLGYAGANNGLSVSNGGQVEIGMTYIGYGADALGNYVSVSGLESKLVSSGDIYVGHDGAQSELSVSEGARVESLNGVIGWADDADGNQVLVSDGNSSWVNSGDLHVGYEGGGNALTISNGGTVGNRMGSVGVYSSNNTALVTGVGSSWTNASGLYVGAEGAGNSLTVSDGGSVSSDYGYIGRTAAANGNSVMVSDAGSTWQSGNLFIGDRGADNSLVITNGGMVVSENSTIGIYSSAIYNEVLVSDTGSIWSNSRDLYLGFGAVSNSLTISNGGRVENIDGYIGYDSTASGNKATVSGSGSVWAGSGELMVGHHGSENSLVIENGGLVSAATGIIGGMSNAWYNTVAVSGADAELRMDNDLQLGGILSVDIWVDGGRGNALYVGDGGLVSVGRNLDNRNYSSITVDPGASITVASNYYQDATSSLKFGVETNHVGAPVNALVSVDGTAEFEAGATIEYASNVGQLEFDRFYTNKIVEADSLIIAGKTNPDALDLELLDGSGTLVDVLFWENDADIYGLVGRVHLADSAGFDTHSMMGRLSRELDDMSLLGDDAANRLINLLNGMSGLQQHGELMQQYAVSTPNHQHIQSMTEGMRVIKKQGARYESAHDTAPKGVKGPYKKEQGLQGWAKPYGSWSVYDSAGGFEGYDHNIYGTVVGFDLPMDGALMGIAGGYGRSVIAQNDSDNSEAKTGYGVLYFTHGTEEWFGHLNIAFGRSKVNQHSGTVFENSSDFDASNFATYIEGGKEMMMNRRLSFTPKASLLWSYYYQESYTEKSNGGVAREVDAYEHDSVLSSLGAALAYRQPFDTMVLKPEARFYWLHEFNVDTDSVDYTLQNGLGGQYQFVMPAPNEDVFEAGLGLSCIFNDELELVIDVDGRLGENYSGYAVSGRMIWEF